MPPHESYSPRNTLTVFDSTARHLGAANTLGVYALEEQRFEGELLRLLMVDPSIQPGHTQEIVDQLSAAALLKVDAMPQPGGEPGINMTSMTLIGPDIDRGYWLSAQVDRRVDGTFRRLKIAIASARAKPMDYIVASRPSLLPQTTLNEPTHIEAPHRMFAPLAIAHDLHRIGGSILRRYSRPAAHR